MKSAEENVISFLRSNPSKWASAELQRLSFKNKNGTLASPKAISRRLQENAIEGGMIEVSYDEGGNAYYQIKQEHCKRISSFEPIMENGRCVGRREVITYA